MTMGAMDLIHEFGGKPACFFDCSPGPTSTRGYKPAFALLDHHPFQKVLEQTESMTGKPFARYWMHNGMLQLAGEKMSKSLGNLITIDEFLTKHSSDALRIILMQDTRINHFVIVV